MLLFRVFYYYLYTSNLKCPFWQFAKMNLKFWCRMAAERKPLSVKKITLL
jgi:hypothetical protein